jgi:biotin operon repressor
MSKYIKREELPKLAKLFFNSLGLNIRGKDEKQEIRYGSIGILALGDKSLSAGAFRVFGTISMFCGDKGYCWVSQDVIGEITNLSRRQVNRIIKELKSKGYINTDEVKQANNRFNLLIAILYHPNLKELYQD